LPNNFPYKDEIIEKTKEEKAKVLKCIADTKDRVEKLDKIE
jgi:hypothetical protein